MAAATAACRGSIMAGIPLQNISTISGESPRGRLVTRSTSSSRETPEVLAIADKLGEKWGKSQEKLQNEKTKMFRVPKCQVLTLYANDGVSAHITLGHRNAQWINYTAGASLLENKDTATHQCHCSIEHGSLHDPK